MSLAGHIDELRVRIVRMIFVILGAWVLGWFLQPAVYSGLNSIIEKAVAEYRQLHPTWNYAEPFTNLTQPFLTQLRLSFMLGLGIAMPFVVLEIWGFVRPGLKLQEARPIAQLAPVSVVLFFLGAACCWMVLPITFQWFLSFFDNWPGTSLNQEPGTMVMFTLKMLFAFGLAFQLPLVIFIAGKIGLVTPETIRHYWRHAAVFVFLASAVLTPSSDPVTMLMMAIPLSVLVMLSIVAVGITSKKSSTANRPAELDDLD